MGVKYKNNRFYLSLLFILSTIYAASFLISDSYSYFTTELSVSGELIMEEDFGIPLTLQAVTEEEQVEEETVKEEQLEKKESTDGTENSTEKNKEAEAPSEPVKEEKEEEESQPDSESEPEVEDNAETQETSINKELEDGNIDDKTSGNGEE